MGGMAGPGVPNQGLVGQGMGGQAMLGQGMIPAAMGAPNSALAAPYGTVTCYICGKTGHYLRNCWQAANRQRSEDDQEMRELLKKIAKRGEEEEKRRLREAEEARRREEIEKREGDKLREEEAREAKLEVTIVRILSQRKEPLMITPAPQQVEESKKQSPCTKARMLREIRSYIAESDEDSEEVKIEVEKLVEAFENRKKQKKSSAIVREATNRMVRKRATPKKGKEKVVKSEEVADDFATPKKACPTECTSEGVVEFTLSQTKVLSALKAGDIRKICDREGVQYIVKDQAIGEIVRCGVQLAYEGFFYVRKQQTSTAKQGGAVLNDPSTTRNSLKIRIARVVKEKFGVDIRRRLYVKIPFSAQVDLGLVRDLVVKVITASVKDIAIRNLVIEKLSMVKTKGRTVASLIHNYRKKIEARHDQCACSGLVAERYQGHIRARIDTFQGVHRFVCNARNVTCGWSMTSELLVEAIHRAVPKIWRSNMDYLACDEVGRCFSRQVTGCMALAEKQVV
ncbi:hypothetical protein CBR_g74623 [Chara braunii]|uniref:CCHC-type domain-containing protein n=1 Tax=Chara braunii TaxID=69332 RepID=A0A388KA87_CHABU|nr:hypothetical protein CBR_g74623 [Chara braunii]|eukprot:GBG66936.1 hypothetical protein CBR_g74623 [Chara braunii]